MNTAFESTDSKIVKAPSLEALLSGIELSAPHLDFYGKNIEENAKKEKVASYIRTDVLRLIRLFEESFFVKWGIGIEDYTLSNLRRKLRLESRKRKNAANSKTPIIRTFVDRLRKGISKANFTIKANPLTNEWKDSIESVETAMAWAYSSSGMRTTLIDVIHSALLNGNGYVKAKFMTPKERLNSIKNPDSKEYIKISNFYSQVERISEFDLFYDPALPLHKQRFVVYRSIKPMKSILEVIQHMDQKISPEHLNYVLKNPKPFSHKDFNQVRLIKYLGPEAAKKKNNYAIDNIYNITYNNDKAEYVEIWTPDTLSICINGWIVADTENPYKDREYWHPYYSCHYAENPGVSVGEGAGIILGDIQAAYDSLFNMLLDHSAMTASPMLWVQAGKVIFNKKAVDGTLPWEAWGVLEMEDKGNMDFITPPPLDKGIVSTLQNMLETANFSISPTSYSDYNSQSRSAQDSMLRFEGLADSVSLLVDSVSLMLNRIAQNWLIDMQSKMPELFQLPVFNAK